MPKIVDHDERRAELTDALWAVVRRDGAQALSIRSLADEAGVSPASVIYYFRSRGALLAAAVEQVNRQAEDVVRRRSAEPLTLDRAVATIVEATVPLTPERRRQADVWLLLLTEGHNDPEIRKVLHRFNLRIRDGLEQGITAMKAAGLVARERDDATEAAALHALLDGLSIQTITNSRTMSRPLVEQIVRDHLLSLAHA